MFDRDQTLWMVLRLTVIAGQETAFELFFAELRAKVAAEEPGTLRFDMHRVQGSPGRYVMIEQYADQAAWDEHSRLQGIRNVVPQMAQFSAAQPEFIFLAAVAGALR